MSKAKIRPTHFSRKGLKSEAQVKELLKAHSLSTLELGRAADDGDCFFDALAQYVNIINDTHINSTKYLRTLCHGFYTENAANKALVDIWNESDYGSELSAPDEYYMIQYTAQECRADFHGRPPIWGRLAVEGIILCRQLELESILVIEVLEDPETNELILSYHLVTQETYKSIAEEDAQTYSDNPRIPILINSQSSLHFVPLMRKAISSPEVCMTQFSEHYPTGLKRFGRDKWHREKYNSAKPIVSLCSLNVSAIVSPKHIRITRQLLGRDRPRQLHCV